MSNETALRLLKQALQIGDKTALIREAINELEGSDRSEPVTNIQHRLLEIGRRS